MIGYFGYFGYFAQFLPGFIGTSLVQLRCSYSFLLRISQLTFQLLDVSFSAAQLVADFFQLVLGFRCLLLGIKQRSCLKFSFS